MSGLKKLVVVGVMACLAGLASCSSSPSTPSPSTPAVSGPETPSITLTSPASTTTEGAAGDTVACAYPASGTPAKPVSPPSTTDIPATGTVTVTMHMDAGDVVMNFVRDSAPCAVHSFESLASQKYFDNTSCHRLVLGFVLQCGDPTGSGSGGPGYSFKDELTGSETYPVGTVAMANSGANTNGSQFFIVIGTTYSLQPDYTVLGTVDAASMQVVQSIVDQGIDPSDPQGIRPAEGGHIQSVTTS